MTDVHEPEVRSYNMSRIKSKDTKPEMIVRRFLFKNGFRYRLHVKDLPGKPDIVLSKYKSVIFVNGCFWHGHENCKYFKLPGTRAYWWKNKINTTIERDKKKIEELLLLGWSTLIIWECELKLGKRENTLNKIYLSITRGVKLL
jgi:DNA mismatch endonuclease, patch repair protein